MKKLISISILTIIAALLFVGCTSTDLSDFINSQSSNKVKLTTEEAQTIEAGDADKLVVNNQTGAISVSRGNDNNIKVLAYSKVEGAVTKEVNEILNNIALKLENNNNSIMISIIKKDDNGDFWSWKNNKHTLANVSIDLTIKLPRNFSSYRISSITGDIKLLGLTGEANISNITGSISLDNIKLTKSSDISLTTGNISLDIDTSAAEAINIKNVTGNIDLLLPSDSKLDLDASIVTGNIKGNLVNSLAANTSKFSEEINGGGTNISIGLITGNININSK